jgi:hypothetical protein
LIHQSKRRREEVSLIVLSKLLPSHRKWRARKTGCQKVDSSERGSVKFVYIPLNYIPILSIPLQCDATISSTSTNARCRNPAASKPIDWPPPPAHSSTQVGSYIIILLGGFGPIIPINLLRREPVNRHHLSISLDRNLQLYEKADFATLLTCHAATPG